MTNHRTTAQPRLILTTIAVAAMMLTQHASAQNQDMSTQRVEVTGS